jgi:hypothetical protein
MIGLDRPLKPEWIYNILKIMQIGDKPGKYNEKFENIAKELVGKEGKRKVRTIIFRSFLYSFQKNKSKIENNIFLELTKNYDLNYLTPLFLLKLIMDYEIVRFIIKKIEVSLDSQNLIFSQLISNKMVAEHGDRDVVKRSVRVFFRTLCNFGIMSQENNQKFKIQRKYKLSDEQTRDFIKLYSISFAKSNFIDIDEIDKSMLFFLEDIDFDTVAKKFNNKCWEYIRDGRRNVLLMRN